MHHNTMWLSEYTQRSRYTGMADDTEGIMQQDVLRRHCDWSNKWDFVTLCSGAGRYLTHSALPCHTLALTPDKRKSLRSYTASAKPDFTAERSAVSGGVPSELDYRVHQEAAAACSRRLHCRVMCCTGKHLYSYHVPVLSVAMNIS